MNPWYRELRPMPNAALRLVVIPHAGGGPAYYRDLAQCLPPGIDAFSAVLPGRESRWKEKPFDRMEPLVDALVTQLATIWDRPIALLGHSLGAIIAYEVAQRMPVEMLIVTGARAPQLSRQRSPLHQLDDAALLQELVQFGGTPSDILVNEELLALYLPTLRADLTVLETYKHGPKAELSVPICVLVGFVDEKTPLADVIPWRNVTRGHSTVEALPGGHFFYLGQESTVLQSLGDLACVKSRAMSTEPVNGVINLHVIDLDPAAPIVALTWDSLSAAERERGDRLMREELRRRYAITRHSLRCILGQRLGILPQEVQFIVSPSGKPELAASHGSNIRFNLSHSEDIAVIAIANDVEVGIDIERIRLDVDHRGLSQRYFDQGEQNDLAQISDAELPVRFFTYWTAKEAYSKCRGLGLNLPLDEYGIRLDPSGQPVAVDDRTLPAGTHSGYIVGLNIRDGFAAALASTHPINCIHLYGES